MYTNQQLFFLRAARQLRFLASHLILRRPIAKWIMKTYNDTRQIIALRTQSVALLLEMASLCDLDKRRVPVCANRIYCCIATWNLAAAKVVTRYNTTTREGRMKCSGKGQKGPEKTRRRRLIAS